MKENMTALRTVVRGAKGFRTATKAARWLKVAHAVALGCAVASALVPAARFLALREDAD
jgi:hypothetical protein